MAELKTKATNASVEAYINKIPDKQTQTDCRTISDIMKKVTKSEPKMWGPAIVGYGSYHYKYDSGHEGDAPLAGIASRANAITLYLPLYFDNREELLSKFGKYKTGKGCIYLQKIEDIDTSILARMVENSILYWQKKYPG